MHAALDPFSFLVLSLAGWMNQHQQHVIHYLIEENRVLREQLGNRRMRFTDDQRRRLAVRAKKLGPAVVKGGRNDRDSGDLAGLAPKADREEIRRNRKPWTGTATHGRRNCSPSDSNGKGESYVGLPADSRSAGEPWLHGGTSDHRQHSEGAWD